MGRGQWNALVQRVRRWVAPGAADEPSDRRLLRRFADERDEDAFTRLVERHGPMVLRVCRQQLVDEADAEDAFQATFCVLARKAAATGWQESIAGWLYAVARRVARKARAQAQRRRQRESEAAKMHTEDASAPDRDLRALLNDELERLPEKYRAPLILCYLEGQTNEEAARLLGWPKGTVQGRLARARELLKSRLTRRGVAPGAALALLEVTTATAALPGALVQRTVAVALPFAVGIVAGNAPGSVIVLAEGVLHTMWLTKLKITAFLLVLGTVGLGAGVFLFGGLDRPPAQLLAVSVREDEQPKGGLPFPDGIATSDGKVAYVTNAEAKIDALDLATGITLWTSASVGRPLLLADGKLYAQIDAIDSEPPPVGRWQYVTVCRIAVLDPAQKGKVVWQSEPIKIGDVSEDHGDYFQLSEARLDQGALRVRWISRFAPYFGGRFPGKEVLDRLARNAGGTAQINLETYRVTLKLDYKSSAIDAADAPKTKVPPGTPKELIPVYEKNWKLGPVVRADRLVAVEDAEGNSGEWKVVLRTWDMKTGKAGAVVDLVEGPKDRSLSAVVTPDDRHLLITNSQGKLQAVFSFPDGKRAADQPVSLPPGSVPYVYDFGLFDVQKVETDGKRTLRSMDTRSGKVVWEHALRGQPRSSKPLPP